MDKQRPLAVSMVAFDGVASDAALEAIADAGATHAEPAFIDGTVIFSEDDFSDAAALRWRRRVQAAGLACVALSGHIDCGAEGAALKLQRRIRFAATSGARFVITNTTRCGRRAELLRTITQVLPVAEAEGVVLAFENPGYGPDDLLRCAASATSLLSQIDSPWIALNYDVGNALTSSEGALRPEEDLEAALPAASHLHLKDVMLRGEVWTYTALGDGDLDYGRILARIAAHPWLPVCVELPFGQLRRRNEPPIRKDAAPSLAMVRDAIARSVRRDRAGLEVSPACA